MMPTLSTDQKQREKIGSFARICANVGMFAVVVGIKPITEGITQLTGNAKLSWLLFAIAVCVADDRVSTFYTVGRTGAEGLF